MISDRAVVGLTDSGASVFVARHDDVPRVRALLSAAVHWVAALGYRQWWDPFPVETIEDLVRRGETDVTVKGASDMPEQWRCALYKRSTRAPLPRD